MKLKITLSAFALTMILTGSLQAEYIFLKDGSIIQGTITTDSATSLTLRLKGKGFQRIPRSNIMRILYTELYMGKVYVQKTDGKGIVAYMVDEDRETYTFRIELYKPDEFILKRDQVLFMARGLLPKPAQTGQNLNGLLLICLSKAITSMSKDQERRNTGLKAKSEGCHIL